MMLLKILVFLSVYIQFGTSLTDEDYGSMPDVFHLDNYDNCMSLKKEALYCSFSYQLAPLNSEKPSKLWKIIEEASASPKNYDHDNLRHGICVPKTCPKIPKNLKNESNLSQEITKCYNEKFSSLELKGKVTKIYCETKPVRYEIDNLDITVAVIFAIYLAFVIFASFYEGIARYGSPEVYTKLSENKFGRILFAFSICKNWYRLKTIRHENPEVQKLRCIQGIRLYNTVIVTFSHSVLALIIAPVSNTRYVETMTEKFLAIFLSSGGLCVSTFFCISTFLVTSTFFKMFEGKKTIQVKTLVMAFFNRYVRIIPSVLVVLLFHCTWLVHLADGPNWDNVVGTEYRNCRKNWWSNLLMINNYIDRPNMCLQTTWYLSTDTQLYVFALFGVWLMKKYENKILLIITTMFGLNILLIFSINYWNDYTGFILPEPETYYNINFVQLSQFHDQLSSISYNFGGVIMGLGFGYIYYKYSDKKMFTKKIYVWIWWILSYGAPLGIIIFPGLYIFDYALPHSAFWASAYVAINRIVFSFGIALMIFGCVQGIGWMSKFALEWAPTYVLGRITFGAFLVQVGIIKITPGLIRAPVFINDYLVFSQTLSDLFLSLLAGTGLCLLFEMPISELQKLLMSAPKNKEKLIKSAEKHQKIQ